MSPDAVRALATSMPIIEQAKGILMGTVGCDAATAFAVLSRLSSASNMKLRDIAAAFVDAATKPASTEELPTTAAERVRRLLGN